MHTVEDYIEYIAGSQISYHDTIKLARYDVNIVASMAIQISNGVAFTDRQADLAHKIAVKYKKQLSTHGVTLGNIEQQPVYRMPVRKVNRERNIKIVNNTVQLIFPYHPEIIDHIRSSSAVHGSLYFDREQRLWKGAVTESRLLWLETLIDKYHFVTDQTFLELLEKVKNCQAKEYQIELIETATGFDIKNAETSLQQYVLDHFGVVDNSNVISLVDHSKILGFSVSNSIKEKYINDLDPKIQKLILEKQLHMPLSQEGNLELIFDYLALTDRSPLCVYDPIITDTMSSTIHGKLKKKFGSALCVLSNKQRKIDVSGAECVYFNNWRPDWQMKIPLLICLTGMMIGPRKQQILQCANKIVYMTESVYNEK